MVRSSSLRSCSKASLFGDFTHGHDIKSPLCKQLSGSGQNRIFGSSERISCLLGIKPLHHA
jgi:hypothetical protein